MTARKGGHPQRKALPTPDTISLSQVTTTPTRNQRFFDTWSLVHISFGVLFGWALSPLIAMAILVAWEPLEIFILSPLLARVGVNFGFESLRNSLSDIFFDAVGVTIGSVVLTALVTPPAWR